MNQTIKFNGPVPLLKIKNAVRKAMKEYLPSSNLDEFSKMMWKKFMEEFIVECAFNRLSPDMKHIIHDKKVTLWRDYDCSDLGTQDFILLDGGTLGRILVTDDGRYSPDITSKFTKDSVFTGIQVSISESYEISGEQKEKTMGDLKGIAMFIVNQVNSLWVCKGGLVFNPLLS